MDAERIDYRVLVHHEDGSYWAEVEQLPGCFATGDTLEELWEALEEAIGLYLSGDEGDVQVHVETKAITTEQVDARVLVH